MVERLAVPLLLLCMLLLLCTLLLHFRLVALLSFTERLVWRGKKGGDGSWGSRHRMPQQWLAGGRAIHRRMGAIDMHRLVLLLLLL